ncbi:tetratricopeptide repeat-containing protein [Babesia ovis]|uniref:peptidylprolyl isomerase n=1 Tax=Babesia ovis TaxID=5869 RepID=A0A9W5WUY4_BABOV|nr:tetratricopeptide repeat-containing protein [Babesia ovis]
MEIVDVTNQSEPTQAEEPTDTPISCKVRGAELFKSGDIDGAIDVWFSGLRALQFILNKKTELERDATSQEEFKKKWDIFVNTYVELSTNMSLALMKKGDYTGCIKYCQQALQYDKNNLKAYLRITQANAELGHFSKAIAYCNEAINANPNNMELKILGRKVQERARAHDRSQKVVMKRIFQRLEHDPRSAEGPLRSAIPKMIFKTAKGLWFVLSPVLRIMGRLIKVVFDKHIMSHFNY